MNELTNNEKAKVFAMYYPCKLMVNASKMHSGRGKNCDLTKVEADFDSINRSVDNGQFIGITYGQFERGLEYYSCFDELCRAYQDFTKPDYAKLILTPLDKISDEDQTQVSYLQGYEQEVANVHFDFRHGFDCCVQWKGYNHDYYETIQSNTFQYLLSKSYSVPLFFGINHWANGKTAIQLNLAITKS